MYTCLSIFFVISKKNNSLKENLKVPLKLAISLLLPRLTVMVLIPVTATEHSEHKPFVWQFLPARG